MRTAERKCVGECWLGVTHCESSEHVTVSPDLSHVCGSETFSVFPCSGQDGTGPRAAALGFPFPHALSLCDHLRGPLEGKGSAQGAPRGPGWLEIPEDGGGQVCVGGRTGDFSRACCWVPTLPP